MDAGGAKTDDSIAIIRAFPHQDLIYTDNSRTRSDKIECVVFTHTANHLADLGDFPPGNRDFSDCRAVVEPLDQRFHQIRMGSFDSNVIQKSNWLGSDT